MSIDFVQENLKETANIPNSFVMKLPSKGKFYPSTHPFHNKEDIVVKHITGEDIDIIANPSYIQNGKVFDMLLGACVQARNFNPQQLLSVDEDAIIANMRINSLGTDYTPFDAVKCSKCRTEFNPYTYQITRLTYDGIDDFNVEEIDVPVLSLMGKESTTKKVMAIKTVWQNHEIYYKFLTTEDKKRVQEQADKLEDRMGKSSRSMLLFAEKIIAYDGNTDKMFITTLYKNMLYKDALDIQKVLKEPSFNMYADFNCLNASCKHSEEVSVDFDVTFLYPRNTSK